jgi:hypothetical protein
VGPASAQTPPPITSNHYAIELFQGPLLAPIHVTGVGGAYVALAEDTEGAAVNSASPAVRDPYSTTWFAYDVSAGISFPGAFSNTDFDNHGDFANLPSHASAGNFLDVNVGATLQFGGLGVAGTSDLQEFSLSTAAPGTPAVSLEIGRWKLLGAYGMFDGQLAVGGGARIVTMQVKQDGGGTLLTMTGFAPEVGALLMPTGQQWRIGATARAPVSGNIFGSENVTTDANGQRTAGGFILPDRVVMPWEIEAGVAYQLGPRPINPGWKNPHSQEAWLRRRIASNRAARALARDQELAPLPGPQRDARRRELEAQEASIRGIEDAHLDAEIDRLRQVRAARYANWPREKIVLLASVLITGPSTNSSQEAISLEGFLDQRSETVGRVASLIPRFGVEGEPLRDRMLLRVGTYVEPSRYDDGTPRQHFTFGTDVRLFPLDFWGLLPEANWKLGVFVDLAPRYANGGIGIGEWH